MSEFLKVLKRLVGGDDSVALSEVISTAKGEDMDTTPAFIFWATVGTPKFDIFLNFCNFYPTGEFEPKLANPNCYHFYGKKKKFEFSKAMDDIVALVQILPEGGPFGDLGSTFSGLFAVYADVNRGDFRLYDDYSIGFLSALRSKGERTYDSRYWPSINFSFAWLGKSENLKELATLDVENPEPNFTHLLGTGTTTIDSYMEKNVHAPEEYVQVVLSMGNGFFILQDMIRSMPSDLMVFDPITGGTRAIESHWKLFDVYLKYLKINQEMKFQVDRIKTTMVNKLAVIDNFTPDALKWLADSDRAVKIDGLELGGLSGSDISLLMADPMIASMIENASGDWTKNLSTERKKNKIKVDSVIGVLVEKGMDKDAINMVIQSAMPWQLVWVGVDDKRESGLKSEALTKYIVSKVVELQQLESKVLTEHTLSKLDKLQQLEYSKKRPLDAGKSVPQRKKIAPTKMLMVSRKLSDEQLEIVNKLRPLFSYSLFVEDQEANKLLSYENIILQYIYMIDDAVDDGRLKHFFQTKIQRARSLTNSDSLKLLEVAIQRIEMSEDPKWIKEDADGTKLKDRVADAYWIVKNETD